MQLGVDYFYVVDFNKEFTELSPNEFVKHYIINLNVTNEVAGLTVKTAIKVRER